MITSPQITIIIVSYNTAQLTIQCLNSIQTSISGTALEQATKALVIDNHSSDDSADRIRVFAKQHSWVTLWSNDANMGFAEANNQAIKIAQGNYIWLLNSDTIISPGVILALITRLQTTDQLGMVTPELKYPDGCSQPQGGDLPTLPALWCFALLLDDLPVVGKWLPSIQHTGRRAQKTSNFEYSGWIGGTALMLRRSLVEEIGPLSDEFFMYAEDVEWCWRARQSGWRCGIDHTVSIVHYGSQSSSTNQAIIGELTGLLRATKLHLPAWQLPLAWLAIFTAGLLRWLLFTVVRSSKAAAYGDFLHAKMSFDHV